MRHTHLLYETLDLSNEELEKSACRSEQRIHEDFEIAMKGIILAGGSGSRLYPSTLGACKQLLPVYDKPMVYYPLSVLMLAGIRDILLISTPQDLPLFERMLGDGGSLGVSIQYAVQDVPRGLADAFVVGEAFLNGSPTMLILGDNIFFGSGFSTILKNAVAVNVGCTIFGYTVEHPEAYGVVRFDGDVVAEIVEKPKLPPSKTAVTGLYIYDQRACEFVRGMTPSARGELEITDLNNCYLEDGALNLVGLPRGYAWLDTGTHESMMEAAQYVRAVEGRQGLKIGCIEEVAFRQGWIDRLQLAKLAQPLSKTGYGRYLLGLVDS